LKLYHTRTALSIEQYIESHFIEKTNEGKNHMAANEKGAPKIIGTPLEAIGGA
jgi:hypothetical protein